MGRRGSGGRGRIDDVRIFSRSLSESQIGDLYEYESSIPDSDSDGISDFDEIEIFGTDPNDRDSDNDGLDDGFEVGFGRYDLVAGEFTWSAARDDAILKGGYLATFGSASEYEFVLTRIFKNIFPAVWIGATDEEIEGDWKWVTGEPWEFNHWAPEQPDNRDLAGTTHFLHLYGSEHELRGAWNDRGDAGVPFHSGTTVARLDPQVNPAISGYILELGYSTDPLVADTDDDGIGDGVEFSAGTNPLDPVSRPSYELIKGSFTWEEARTDAEKRGGHLATITNQIEQNIIALIVNGQPGDHFWLGATDSDVEGNWRWITGEDFGYTAWSGGEPNNQNNEDVIAIMNRSGNLWIDGNGGTRNGGYLIEYGSVAPEPEVPFISITPSTVTTVVGSMTTLVANLSVSSDTAFYQWFKDGAPLIGESTSDLSLSNLSVSESGSYTVNVIVNQRSELSQPTILTVTDPDADGDGLVLSQENQLGTNPDKSDTDDDGLNDGTEVNTTLTDPRNPDSDGDGVTDGVEIASGSDPRNPNEIPIPSGRMTIAKLGAGLEIRIHTSEGHRYQLQRSRGLIEWEDDGELIRGTGSDVKVQREKFEVFRFWRVLVTQ